MVLLAPQALLGQPEQLVLTVLLALPDLWVQQALPAQMAWMVPLGQPVPLDLQVLRARTALLVPLDLLEQPAPPVQMDLKVQLVPQVPLGLQVLREQPVLTEL